MRTVGMSEAKQKLSELVRRAERGERIGITRRGELTAVIVSSTSEPSVKDIFRSIEEIRKRTRRLKGVTLKRLIGEGRV